MISPAVTNTKMCPPSTSDQVSALSSANKEICHGKYRDHHGLDYAEKSDNECRVERQEVEAAGGIEILPTKSSSHDAFVS